MKLSRTLLLLAATGLLLPLPAKAACSTSATLLAFGSYNPFAFGSSDSTGTITVSCTGGLISLLLSYDIKLSPGLYGSYATRKMGAGSNRLDYNLYTTVLRTTIWGDGSGGTGFVSDGYLLGVLTVNRNYSVYGRLPAAQNVAPASYSDTITVTVDY